MRVAPTVKLSEVDREWLLKQARSGLAPKRLGERCRIVLLAAEGKTNEEIEEDLGVSRHKAGRWRARFAQSGRAGIESDAPGRGRKPSYPPELRQLVVRMTTREKPDNATHWSLATMAKALDISPRTVGRIWLEHGLKPHLLRTFKVSNDPRSIGQCPRRIASRFSGVSNPRPSAIFRFLTSASLTNLPRAPCSPFICCASAITAAGAMPRSRALASQ
jgi:transposase